MSLLTALRTNTNSNETQNGCATNETSLNSVLDLFFIAGAARNLSVDEIEKKLLQSYLEDSALTLKLIFWAGDIRNGLGERRFFRIALNWLKNKEETLFEKNIHNVPQYNRWDSLFAFHSSETVLNYVRDYLEIDGLLAKWMPREGKSKNKEFLKAFLSHTKMTPKEYRQMVVTMSKTVEQQMSANQFNSIIYSHVPSIAFSKYKKAFTKHDESGFTAFVESVKKGDEKINAGAIFPYQIYQKAREHGLGKTEVMAMNEQWKALPNYLKDSTESILPICDTSGSMDGLPYDISVSLGMYFSERNKGAFKDAFITFSEKPKLQYLKGTLSERMTQFEQINAGNTDLQATFKMILETAVKNKVDAKDMPTMLLIISDMEFDQGVKGVTAHQDMAKKYEDAGYSVPKVVYWNVDAKSTKNLPVTVNDKGVALVSGSSPVIIKSVLSGTLSPLKVVLETLNHKNYDGVVTK